MFEKLEYLSTFRALKPIYCRYYFIFKQHPHEDFEFIAHSFKLSLFLQIEIQ
jgi:hypothetical protein